VAWHGHRRRSGGSAAFAPSQLVDLLATPEMSNGRPILRNTLARIRSVGPPRRKIGRCR